MKSLAILYGRYLGQNQGRPPRDEKAFKKFLETEGTATMEQLGVASVDDMFVSERDGSPYVVIYGKLGPRIERIRGVLTMYESTGVDGMRFVATELGTIEKLTDEEFGQIVPKAK